MRRSESRSLGRRSAVVVGAAALALTAMPGTVAAATSPAPACAPDWPMYQHDMARTGATCAAGGITATNVATLVHQWTFLTGNNPVTATPTVSGARVFVGDAAGNFYAINRTTGQSAWAAPFSIQSNSCHDDHHSVSYGEITSSAAVGTLANGRQLVYFGGGGTLYALDAATGACIWSQDLDPATPASAMEVESSPVVLTQNGHASTVIVGSDSNEGPGSSAPPGVQAFGATDGSLLWKYEPEVGATGTVTNTLSTTQTTDGCGDVWTSPAVDPGAGAHGLVVFGTGNCPAQTTVESIVAIDANTGSQVWRFAEPASLYTSCAPPSATCTPYADGGDTDFGASPILTTIGTTPAVIEASKSGYVYALNETSGAKLWSTQAAQPGELGGSNGIGGFIGADALGTASLAGTSPTSSTWFGSSAIPATFQGDGTTPDSSMVCNSSTSPTTAAWCQLRSASLHAVDAATGNVLWQAPVSLPSYSAVTYANGVVFAPSTTGFAVDAYDASTGTPLWSFPLGASVGSGAAVVGPSIYLGSGIAESGTNIPGVDGVWSFCLAGQCPSTAPVTG